MDDVFIFNFWQSFREMYVLSHFCQTLINCWRYNWYSVFIKTLNTLITLIYLHVFINPNPGGLFRGSFGGMYGGREGGEVNYPKTKTH